MSEKNSPLILNLRITPHRSMNASGVRALFIVLGLLLVPVAVMFFVMGAWPVMPFMGAEVALLAVALMVNFRRARVYETVRLTRDRLTVERVDNSHRKSRTGYWRFEPRGTAVRLVENEDGSNTLSLVQSTRRLGIARFIGADERKALAETLRDGLKKV